MDDMAYTSDRRREKLRWQIGAQGTVQGVGFRPFVYQLAQRHKLAGWVRNTSSGVLIEVEGDEEALGQFLSGLRMDTPQLASISQLDVIPISAVGDSTFEIHTSLSENGVRTAVPPDVAVCAECAADIAAPGNRRYKYPFTNCTNCGPRFTIISGIPYDRPNTTMRDFRMCPDCQVEYEDPTNRRFHAQPNACPVCGPHLALDGVTESRDDDVIRKIGGLLHEGRIAAVKGLGGYHLACDARNSDAVMILRERKGRGEKPFALMCADVDEVRRICITDDVSESLLLSPESPIVLLPRSENSDISPCVAPGTNLLGVMLPYTPLHMLLMAEAPRSLVMTSGNLAEEPIVHVDAEVPVRLGHITDHVLSHSRPVHVPCDDSVMRVFRGAPMILRRARGFVPCPMELDEALPQVLACGGDLKSTFCITKERQAFISQHLGDLENASSIRHYERMLNHFCRFFDVQPKVVAHDLHPGYHSTDYALSLSGVKKVGVQHHHAHVVSCMAENMEHGQVIGVAFDGTGYGSDGSIWGGEFLIADRDGFRRAAHLAYVPLPGGDASVRRPARMALAYLMYAFGCLDGCGRVPGLSVEEACAVEAQISRRLNSPLTSSMGRLFDAVSALIGVCSEVTYEGQAAIELEAAADHETHKTYGFELAVNSSGVLEIDVRPMIQEIVADIEKSTAIEEISGAFHSSVAEIIAETCCMLRDESGLSKVALSGGVFQNALLLELALRRLEASDFHVLTHKLVPPNDGGISLGQAVIAGHRYLNQKDISI